MRTELQVDINFDQILNLVKQLSTDEKLALSKELEKEAIDKKLSKILKALKTDDLSLETIDQEVEIVRQNIYDQQKY